MKKNWAKPAMKMVDAAVAEWNSLHPRSQPMRIVWGYANAQHAAEEAEFPPEYQQPEALLDLHNRTYNVLLSQSGDPDYPNTCAISCTFDGLPGSESNPEPELPLNDPKRIYNLMRCLEDSIQLSLVPSIDGDLAITVCGLKTTIPIESLSGRVLGEAVGRLARSSSLAYEVLTTGKGDDYWSMGR